MALPWNGLNPPDPAAFIVCKAISAPDEAFRLLYCCPPEQQKEQGENQQTQKIRRAFFREDQGPPGIHEFIWRDLRKIRFTPEGKELGIALQGRLTEGKVLY